MAAAIVIYAKEHNDAGYCSISVRGILHHCTPPPSYEDEILTRAADCF